MTALQRHFGEQAGLGLLLLLSAILLLLAIGAGTGIGEMAIPLDTTFFAVTNRLGWSAVAVDPIHQSVIWDYRLSRSLVAACCGAGLALCGAILQSLLRNALAEPYVLGVSAGASTGAVSIIVLGLGAGSITISAGAFVGAFASFAFVALLSNGARGGAGKTILAGVAASQLFNALTSYIVSTSANAQQARFLAARQLWRRALARIPAGARRRPDQLLRLLLFCAGARCLRLWR